jgi:glutathione S-transferase
MKRCRLIFFPGLEHRDPAFRAINPLGQLPVLDDDGFVVRDAQAILVYLTTKNDASGTWFERDDPQTLARTMIWLAFADQITPTASAARLHYVLGFDLDIDAARKGAHTAFKVLDDHLIEQEFRGENWLTGAAPGVADLACFPYVALASPHQMDAWLCRNAGYISGI